MKNTVLHYAHNAIMHIMQDLFQLQLPIGVY